MSLTNMNFVSYQPEMIPACSRCWYQGSPHKEEVVDSGGHTVDIHMWCPQCGQSWHPAMCPEGVVAICPSSEKEVSV